VSNDRGWRSLGDMGYVDEDGYLYLTDRSTFMIVSDGVNIYPQEAENLLVMHPKLVDAAVFGVPNEEYGEEVKAVVQPADGVVAGPELEAELIAYCRAPRRVRMSAHSRIRSRVAPRPERQALQEVDSRALLAGPVVTQPLTDRAKSLQPHKSLAAAIYWPEM
jgi:acyl-CoA synthetase (AMP-forming)/AMP-acid ligase II